MQIICNERQKLAVRLREPVLLGSTFLRRGEIFSQRGARTNSVWCVSDVTRVIEAVQRGDAKAADELLRLVYEELVTC